MPVTRHAAALLAATLLCSCGDESEPPPSRGFSLEIAGENGGTIKGDCGRYGPSLGQCRTIAFGSKLCGGPWRFLIYSTASTDSVELAAAVAAYNAREAELNVSEGRYSDCSVPKEPQLRVVNGRCVALAGDRYMTASSELALLPIGPPAPREAGRCTQHMAL
jgi:hypothetical protein